jgi:hypothetical protein
VVGSSRLVLILEHAAHQLPVPLAGSCLVLLDVDAEGVEARIPDCLGCLLKNRRKDIGQR